MTVPRKKYQGSRSKNHSSKSKHRHPSSSRKAKSEGSLSLPSLSEDSRYKHRSMKAGSRSRAVLRANLLKASQNKCVYCGAPLTLATLTMDHVYPQRFGGPDIFENLVSACGPCNLDKAHMRPEDWFKARPITAAGFILLARHVSPQYLALAAEILDAQDSPYHDGPSIRPPLKLRSMSGKLRPLINEALMAQMILAGASLPVELPA